MADISVTEEFNWGQSEDPVIHQIFFNFASECEIWIRETNFSRDRDLVVIVEGADGGLYIPLKRLTKTVTQRPLSAGELEKVASFISSKSQTDLLLAR